MSKQLTCEMSKDCAQSVTHVDEKGFVYCTGHGIARRASGPRCRKLRPTEKRMLEAGQCIWYDTRRNTAAEYVRINTPTADEARNLPARNELERESGRRGGP